MRIVFSSNVLASLVAVTSAMVAIKTASATTVPVMASLRKPGADIVHHDNHVQSYIQSTITSVNDISINEQRKLQDSGRIVGGTLAPAGKYRSFAAKLQGCGATLIYEDILLSAAHCGVVFNSGDSIHIGGIQSDGSDAEEIMVDYKVIHPSYNERRTDNDIMIIKLSESSSSPTQKLNFDSSNPSVDDSLMSVGFGATTSGFNYFGDLREVEIFSVNDNDCATIYRNEGYYYSTSNMLCAGVDGGGKDTCQGDSGGPLYDSSMSQVGIVSFGIGCGLPGIPGVYTRVSNYEEWINQMICNHSSNPPYGCIPSPPASTTSCFSGTNMVEVKDVGHIPMSKLQIGDYVRADNGDYSQVYGFGHYDSDLEIEFLQIHLEGAQQQTDGQPLEISSNHLLFVDRGQLNNHQVVPASEVVIGDVLPNGKKVESIKYVTRRGVYSPLTQSGDIIVSGVHASSYVNILHDSNWLLWDQHALGHAYTYPQRLFCKYNIDLCQKETYTNGYSFGASIIIQFASITKYCGLVGSIIASSLSIPLVGLVYMLETATTLQFCFVVVSIITVTLIIFRSRRRLLQK